MRSEKGLCSPRLIIHVYIYTCLLPTFLNEFRAYSLKFTDIKVTLNIGIPGEEMLNKLENNINLTSGHINEIYLNLIFIE